MEEKNVERNGMPAPERASLLEAEKVSFRYGSGYAYSKSRESYRKHHK